MTYCPSQREPWEPVECAECAVEAINAVINLHAMVLVGESRFCGSCPDTPWPCATIALLEDHRITVGLAPHELPDNYSDTLGILPWQSASFGCRKRPPAREAVGSHRHIQFRCWVNRCYLTSDRT